MSWPPPKPWFSSITEFVREGYDIQFECWHCHHQARVDPVGLAKLCEERGLDPCLFRLGDTRACSKCGYNTPSWTVAPKADPPPQSEE